VVTVVNTCIRMGTKSEKSTGNLSAILIEQSVHGTCGKNLFIIFQKERDWEKWKQSCKIPFQ